MTRVAQVKPSWDITKLNQLLANKAFLELEVSSKFLKNPKQNFVSKKGGQRARTVLSRVHEATLFGFLSYVEIRKGLFRVF